MRVTLTGLGSMIWYSCEKKGIANWIHNSNRSLLVLQLHSRRIDNAAETIAT